MANKIFDPGYSTSINQRFREKRFRFFLSLLDRVKSGETIQILDIGGTEAYWESMNFTEDSDVIVTLLNLDVVETKRANFVSVKGDARNLAPYKDKQFDIVFSNSVIEHLFSYGNQKMMADEVMRVGRWYYVQTPNYYFPLEPHWLFPFFQFLPFTIRVSLTRNFSLGHYQREPRRDDAIKRVSEVKLLTCRQMQNLFPTGKVYRERFLGLTKSITMYRFPES